VSLDRPTVLIVIPQLDIGGAERQVVHLASALGAAGFDVEVAVFYPDGELEPMLRASGVPVRHLKRTSVHGLETIFDLRRHLRRHRKDIVHAFLWPANWRARIAAIAAGVPVVIASPRSVETWLRWYHVVIDRLLARKTSAIVVNAVAIRDHLQKREGLPHELFHVIPNGIELAPLATLPGRPEAKASLGIPVGAPVILTVGNLQPEKNHEDFLGLAAALGRERPEALFVVVGDGPSRAALMERHQALALDGRVRWEGRRTDVPRYLAACDVFVNTSRREGCCNAILEAMAASRPVVAYGVGGNPELVLDGETGRIVPFGLIDGLAAAVDGYLVRPQLAEAHGEAGARRVQDHFSRGAMVARTAGLYRELLARRGSNPM
jgi:glycosyltransferase involved in cell wall biosynthesis